MKFDFNKKYLMALSMFLLMFGHGFSQNPSEKDGEMQKSKQTTNTISDKASTLTHTAPFNAFDTKILPKNSKIKIGHIKEMLNVQLWTFTNVTGNDLKLVFAPLVNLNFFVKFNDKLTVGMNTAQMIQNYLDNKKMEPMTHNMYAYASFQMSKFKLYANVGNFSILDYSSIYHKNMPISTFFTNALYMGSGSYFPRAVVVGVDNDETGFAIGYAENGSGFKFDGKDGWAVCLMEIKGEFIRAGGLVKTNNKQLMANLQIAGALDPNSDFLLQFLNMGDRFACHVMYAYDFNDGRAVISGNGYYQARDGVVGGDIMLRDKPSGLYLGAGVTKNSQFYKSMSDGTPNENWNQKITPFIEIGLVKTVTK